MRPGVEVAGYQLVRSLGEGPLGASWLALDARGAPAVLKALKPSFALRPEGKAALARLGSALKAHERLRHPALPEIYGPVAAPQLGVFGMARAYVDGVPLELGALPPLADRRSLVTLLDAFEQLGQTLLWLHTQGVIHGNVKPSNVLLVRAAGGLQVRLLDAPWSAIGIAAPPPGSLTFLAPEQLRGIPPQDCSDQYALARLLTSMLERVGVAGALPARLARALSQALSEMPAQRLATIADLVAELRAGRTEIGGAEPAAAPLLPPPQAAQAYGLAAARAPEPPPVAEPPRAPPDLGAWSRGPVSRPDGALRPGEPSGWGAAPGPRSGSPSRPLDPWAPPPVPEPPRWSAPVSRSVAALRGAPITGPHSGAFAVAQPDRGPPSSVGPTSSPASPSPGSALVRVRPRPPPAPPAEPSEPRDESAWALPVPAARTLVPRSQEGELVPAPDEQPMRRHDVALVPYQEQRAMAPRRAESAGALALREEALPPAPVAPVPTTSRPGTLIAFSSLLTLVAVATVIAGLQLGGVKLPFSGEVARARAAEPQRSPGEAMVSGDLEGIPDLGAPATTLRVGPTGKRPSDAQLAPRPGGARGNGLRGGGPAERALEKEVSRLAGSVGVACDEGDGRACRIAAEDALAEGDLEGGRGFMERACELGQSEACGRAANHWGAAPEPQSDSRALRLYQRACQLMDAAACHEAALRLRSAQGGPANLQKAELLERQACRLGRAASCADSSIGSLAGATTSTAS
jgi:serine/threonine protein kinase